jgi:hypothetical protein
MYANAMPKTWSLMGAQPLQVLIYNSRVITTSVYNSTIMTLEMVDGHQYTSMHAKSFLS